MIGAVQPQLCANVSSFWEANLNFTGMWKSPKASLPSNIPLSFSTSWNFIMTSWYQNGNVGLHCNHFYAIHSSSPCKQSLRHLKPTEVLRDVLKQNRGYRYLVCCPLCSLTRWLSMCVSKSCCNITFRCNFRCNLLAIFFGITPLHGFASLRECIWFLPTIHVRLFFFFLQGKSVYVSTHVAVRQASMGAMASLEAPFKWICHLMPSKWLCAWSFYLHSRFCSSSSRELKAMNMVCMPPLSPFSFNRIFFLPCLSSLSKSIEAWAFDCQYLGLF